jgi:hypothetical protein
MLSLAPKIMPDSKGLSLPAEIVDDILLRTGDIEVINYFNRFSIIKDLAPKTYKESVGEKFYRYMEGLIKISNVNDDVKKAKLKESASKPVNLVDWAAGTGRLEYLKYLIENTKLVGSTDAMDLAAMNGHFEVVKFLHNTVMVRCTTLAMDA